ncbi:MAG: hypothetical protein LBE18_09170 [Planctomycetaceae bacterium]|jgi:hypothetical protein|nr:hypothetical protein [Planctomycetaceae bacterium]
MKDKEIINTIESIRLKFLELIEIFSGTLPEQCPNSLHELLANSESLQRITEILQVASNSARVRRVCNGQFTCTFVGSSSQGKTTFLAEMFPDLTSRGWLVCDAKDTTSQSLCIAHSPHQNRTVTARSYNYPELVNFINLSRHDCENNNVFVTFDQSSSRIQIDGTNMKAEKKNLNLFKFPLKLDLIPFNRPYEVNESHGNRDFIRSLTTKDAIVTDPIVNVESTDYNALQLRALIKNIQLYSDYQRLFELTENDSELANINFIDTPGQGTAASINKDEILFYCLGEKSKNIVIQLWRDDDLDFLVHFMRCKEQSQFQKLWIEIESQLSAEEVRGLEDRLILLMNSTRDFCEDDNIKLRYTKPDNFKSNEDHFRLVLKENALDKMSHKGTLSPAAICFIDTLYSYESKEEYAETFQNYKPIMSKWTERDGIGYKTLDEMGLVENFKENIESLCNPEDRGHSFFLKTILRLIDKNGPKMLIQKHLKRSGIAPVLQKLSDVIHSYYNEDGVMNSAASKEALKKLGIKLGLTDYFAYEKYVEKEFQISKFHLLIDDFLQRNPEPTDISELFKTLCNNLNSIIKKTAATSPETSAAIPFVEREIEYLYKKNKKLWGYTDTTIFNTPQIDTAKNIIVYTLIIHAKELLTLLFPLNQDQKESNTNLHQTNEDKQKSMQLISTIDDLNNKIQKLYDRYGVK